MGFMPVALGGATDVRLDDRWPGDHLIGEANRRAGVLAGIGVGRGDRVAILHGGSPDFLADLLAVWRLGACAACLNPALSKAEIATVTQFLRPAAILVAGDPPVGLDDPSVPVLCAAEETGGREVSVDNIGSLDDPALILFTSGTTGAPKGVVHAMRSLLARAALNRAHMGDSVLARSLCVLPTHFGHGLIGNILTPLLAGGEVLLCPEMSVAEMGGLGRLLVERRVTFLSSVPAFWRLALRASRPPTEPTLARLHIGSSPLSAELWNAVADWSGTRHVVNTYGITETANWIGGASAAEVAPEDGLVGRPWGGRYAIVDGGGDFHPRGEGEIFVQTPSLMTGYLDRDDLTREALVGGWYRTGDTGVVDGDGRLRLTGRLREEINRAGVKVSPAEVDLLLERHPRVAEACAFAVPDPISGEAVAVAVVPGDGDSLDTDDLRRWCLERIRREAVPQSWYVLSRLPRNDRGKVNRARVRDQCLETADGTP